MVQKIETGIIEEEKETKGKRKRKRKRTKRKRKRKRESVENPVREEFHS